MHAYAYIIVVCVHIYVHVCTAHNISKYIQYAKWCAIYQSLLCVLKTWMTKQQSSSYVVLQLHQFPYCTVVGYLKYLFAVVLHTQT